MWRLAVFASVVMAVALPAIASAPASAKSGGVVTNYTDPSINRPLAITAGPDGALWFTNNRGKSIERITTTGAVTNFTGPKISSASETSLSSTDQFPAAG